MMKFSTYLTLPLAAGIQAVPPCKSPSSLANAKNTYDYIVVGSGPGGGTLSTNLALAGYKVLLIEAGDDQSGAISTEITNLFSFGTPTSWAFYVRHSDDMEQTLRYNLLVWKLKSGQLWVGRQPPEPDAEMLGVYYPRGATLGGSAIVNAAVASLPSDSDWDIFSEGSRDRIWSGRDMRRILEKIEHNNYLEPGTPEARGHGFTGWLQTNVGGKSVYERTLRLPVVQAGLRLLGHDPEKVREYITRDSNYDDPKRGFKEGLFGLPFHVSKYWRRFSPRDRILSTAAEATTNGKKKYKLDLQLNSLATKVLFEDDCSEKPRKRNKPKAVGVEWLEGAAVYKGDPRWISTIKGKTGRAFARKEVIVSGGVFNTPQLLQLSGIGPRKLLEKYDIPVVVDSPGVGRNLQDNYEIPIVGYAQQSLVLPPDPNAPACTFGAPGDPCIELWKNNTGPYTQGGENGFHFFLKTKHSTDGEVDMLIFLVPAPLRGFTPPDANWTTEPSPNTVFSWNMVKIHPQNKAGYIEIRSSDPTETPDINFNYFADGAETDLNAILDVVAWVRRSYALTAAPVGPVTSVEPPCPLADINADGYCKDPEVDKRWIQDQIFGHHPTSTARVGPDDDPLAVLDTRLRVRGVRNLRVVDASAFPRTPGAFPAISTMMLGEKASALVLEDAKRI